MKALRIDGWIETYQKVFFGYRWIGVRIGETVPIPNGELPTAFTIDTQAAKVSVEIGWKVQPGSLPIPFEKEVVKGKIKVRGAIKLVDA